MRRAMLVIVAATVGLAIPAQAGTVAPTALVTVFASQIRAIKAASGTPPVLLPSSLPLGLKVVYPEGGPTHSGYDISLGAVRNCGDADACFVADFIATRGGTLFGKQVKVRGASKAAYHGLACGASCSPPQIEFVVHGTVYTFQANLTTRDDRTTLVDAAQQAISAGAR
ncbi:MAG: hypothetical protein ACLPZR_34310 [Solirubrobacteraceae bacterium]